MRRAAPYMWPVGAVLSLAAILAVAQLVGAGGRTFAASQKVHTVATAAEAYSALRADGARGRVLVLLDERTRVVPRTWMATFMDSLTDASIEPPVLSYNVTSCFVYAGIVREVYFVPPVSVWERELKRVSSRPDSLPEGNGARARFYGVPVHVIQASDLPALGEQAIVYIADGMQSRYDPAFVSRITAPAAADIVVRQVAR